MRKYEWKKQLFYRKSIWLIAGFIVLELLGLICFTTPYDYVLENNREVYNSYLARVDGPLTPEKQDYLETEMERLNQVHYDLEELQHSFHLGEITEEEYFSQLPVLEKENERYVGFTKLYTQYIFVREMPERSFLYTGGWEVLFGMQKPDYLFLLLLISVITPIFCEEYASHMDDLLMTQKKSAKNMARTKIGVAYTIALVLTVFLQLAQVIYCAVRFGLPDWNATLSSLMSFGNVKKDMYLWQAFLLQFGIRIVGYLYVAAFMLFVSSLCKKFALTLMAGIAALPLPVLTMPLSYFLRLPGPWALSVGTVYLNGDSYTGGAEVTGGELTGILIASGMVILGMLWIVWYQNTNAHLKRRHKPAISVLALLVLLTGCTHQKTPMCYNSNTSTWYETDRYAIWHQEESSVVLDKETDKLYTLPLDCFAGECHHVYPALFGEGDKVYIMNEFQISKDHINSTGYAYMTLEKLDLTTLDSSLVYEWNFNHEWFFGMLERHHLTSGFGAVSNFFIRGNGLYYPEHNKGKLVCMDLRTGLSSPVWDVQLSENFAYDGKRVYYTDGYSRLTTLDLDTGEVVTNNQVTASYFLLSPEGIFFLNCRDENTLYRWDEAKKQTVKLGDQPANGLYYDKDYLWLSVQDGYIYRMNHDGTDSTVTPMESICCVGNGPEIYFIDHDTQKCYAMNKETLQQRPLCTIS